MSQKSQKAADFLKYFKSQKKRRFNRKTLKNLIIVFSALGALIIFSLALVYPSAKKASQEAMTAKDKLFKAEEYLKVQDYSEAQKLIQESHQAFKRADKLSCSR